jgi:hypothetical protein
MPRRLSSSQRSRSASSPAASSTNRPTTPSVAACASGTSIRMPLPPTVSTSPPRMLAITGQPQAMASMALMHEVSAKDGSLGLGVG